MQDCVSALIVVDSLTLILVLNVTHVPVLHMTHLLVLGGTLLLSNSATFLLRHSLHLGHLHSLAFVLVVGGGVGLLHSVALLTGLIPALFLPDSVADRSSTKREASQAHHQKKLNHNVGLQ